MHIEAIQQYCLHKKGVTESFPFDEKTLVFKVLGKMFALCALEVDPLSINLKCDPSRAVDLREKYPAVLPGYHMNKQHWNTVQIDGSIPDKTLREWIDHSYDLVFASLPAKKRSEIADET